MAQSPNPDFGPGPVGPRQKYGEGSDRYVINTLVQHPPTPIHVNKCRLNRGVIRLPTNSLILTVFRK